MSLGFGSLAELPLSTQPATASGVTGTSATTNANDTSSASGTTTIVGTSATTNANDASSASGTTTIVGTSSTTNANDVSAASGTTTIICVSATTNADDTSTASGTVGGGGVSGTAATTNADDTSDASGTSGTPATFPVGGAGHPSGIYWGVKKHKRFSKNLDWLMDRVVSEYYGELTEDDVPQKVQKEAAKIVRPYAKDGLKVPQEVNWQALYQDFDAVIRLLELYQRQREIDDEDETWLMMH